LVGSNGIGISVGRPGCVGDGLCEFLWTHSKR
jgi:hypothetical protein